MLYHAAFYKAYNHLTLLVQKREVFFFNIRKAKDKYYIMQSCVELNYNRAQNSYLSEPRHFKPPYP